MRAHPETLHLHVPLYPVQVVGRELLPHHVAVEGAHHQGLQVALTPDQVCLMFHCMPRADPRWLTNGLVFFVL